MRLVSNIVANFVEESNGKRWPSSWKDLEQVQPTYGTYIQWPAESARVQKLVAVDFSLTVERAALQTPENFTAVTPTPGPCYEGWQHGDIQDLRELLARYAPHPPDP